MSTIYAAALNFAGTYAALEPAMHTAPYNAPPKAPVLYIKPPLCRIAEGDSIPCPANVPALRMGGTLALVIGRSARRVQAATALSYIGSYAIANDVSIPEDSYYRPAILQRCRDGFCPMSEPKPAGEGSFCADSLAIRIFVNEQLAAEAHTASLRRSVSQLLADVTDFMTLYPGDVLLVGEPPAPPLARAGDVVRVEVDGLGSLTNRIVREATA